MRMSTRMVFASLAIVFAVSYELSAQEFPHFQNRTDHRWGFSQGPRRVRLEVDDVNHNGAGIPESFAGTLTYRAIKEINNTPKRVKVTLAITHAISTCVKPNHAPNLLRFRASGQGVVTISDPNGQNPTPNAPIRVIVRGSYFAGPEGPNGTRSNDRVTIFVVIPKLQLGITEVNGDPCDPDDEVITEEEE